MGLNHQHQHNGPIHTLKDTVIRLKSAFKLAFGSKLDLFFSHRDILQKEVSSSVARNSMLPPTATSTIKTDVQNVAFCLWALLQSRSVATDVANGTAEALSELTSLLLSAQTHFVSQGWEGGKESKRTSVFAKMVAVLCLVGRVHEQTFLIMNCPQRHVI
jgi:hypothetical protein